MKELIAKFGDENTHVRLLAYLIGRALLRRLTGGHQIDAALELVQALNLDQMHKAEESVRGLDDLQEVRFSQLLMRQAHCLSIAPQR